MMLLLVEARMTSRFWVPRSDSVTVSVPPVFAPARAGADVALGGAVVAPLAGLLPAVGALEGGARAEPPQAANKAIAPPDAASRKTARRRIPLCKHGSCSMTCPPAD